MTGVEPASTEMAKLHSMTQSSSTGVIITQTYRSLVGEMEWVPLEQRTAIISSDDTYLIRIVDETGNPHVAATREYARSGNRWLLTQQNATGDVTFQQGRDLDAPIPELLETTMERGGKHDLDDLYFKLTQDIVPMFSKTDLDVAVSTGLASIVEEEDTSLAVLASVVDVPLPENALHSRYRLWIDEQYGVKFRIQKLNHDNVPVSEGLVEDFRFDIDTSTNEYDFTRSPASGVRSDYFVSMSFNPLQGNYPSTPGVSGLLYPRSLPIGGVLDLVSSTYVTGTQATEWGWMITQELSDGAEVECLVLQGDNRSPLPLALGEYWPPSWNGANPTEFAAGQLKDYSSESFSDATTVDMFEASEANELPPGRVRPLAFKFLVTWQHGVNNRVVFLANGVSRPTALFLAEAYHGVSK